MALALAVGAAGIAVRRRRGGPAGLGVALAVAMLVHQFGAAWTERGELQCDTLPMHPPYLRF